MKGKRGNMHGLRSEGGGNEVDVLSLEGGELALEFEDLHLDAGVLLRKDALTLSSVVIGADLLIDGGEDDGTLAESDLAALLRDETLRGGHALR